DGSEYNGLTFYNLVQAENENLVWSNIYIRNFEARDNEIYVDPNLTDKVLIGEDGMSLFAYSFADDCFQIRDKASTDYVIESHTEFDRFLSSLIQTVS
ncbi:YrhA family protein, partial [Enterobacter asburiae]|uniref:YrhA family protein n=1 Tax=Enterobacter asburiae TaxID=61645 RepID=UPI0025A22005